jgi:protein-S-isoprenylcysteine O-methyltransferase Ste14
MASGPTVVGPAQNAGSTYWQKFLSFLIRKRVRITAVLFVLLLLEDVLERHAPRSLANLGDYKVLLGLAFITCGVALRSWAAGTLHKRTEVTTSGPYGLVRHPLYIGSLMMMIGFCQLVDDAENIWFVLGPILAIYIIRALYEEKCLAAAFPDQWTEYTQKVPRFFPRRVPREFFTNWNLSQWIKNREYQAVSAVLMGLVALQIWQIMLRT